VYDQNFDDKIEIAMVKKDYELSKFCCYASKPRENYDCMLRWFVKTGCMSLKTSAENL
jgi:hypothetical protein